jgi:hypothetical protein
LLPRAGPRLIEAAATLPLATSGLVLGTGLFLMVQPFAPPMTLALPVTVLVNCALSLPYLYRILLPEARALQADYGRLADSLGLTGWPGCAGWSCRVWPARWALAPGGGGPVDGRPWRHRAVRRGAGDAAACRPANWPGPTGWRPPPRPR